MIFKRLTNFYKRQWFFPNFVSLFINPFYIIRYELVTAIRKEASLLNGKLIDLGCGSKPYKELFVNVDEYIGIDIENEGHSHTDEDIDVFYDGKKLPFSNETFNSAFCSEVLEHVFNIDEILAELHRVLKPDAKALFTVPFVWDEHEQPNDFGRYTSFGITHKLEKSGFEVLNLTKTGNFVKVIFQLINLFIFNRLNKKLRILNIFLNVFIIAPFTLIGVLLAFVLPSDKQLYFNNVVLVRKKNRN